MADQLTVAKRDARGTLRMRRLRKENKIPAILYGHGEANVALTVESREIEAAIRHGSQMVELTGELDEAALIKEVQWDQLGSKVMHLDLSRVSKGEQVEVDLTIELRGDAPGSTQGGIINQPLHQLAVRCPADKIPEKLEVLINQLNVGDSITASQLALPEKATLITPADAIVVQCVAVAAEQDDEPGDTAAGMAEPEVIGRKADDEDESGDS